MLAILVEACGESDDVGKCQPHYPLRCLHSAAVDVSRDSEFVREVETSERQAMCTFRIERKQQRPR